MRRSILYLYLLVGLQAGLWNGGLLADEKNDTVRVMSFNIRYGTASDGDNVWDRRKEFLAETIEKFGPDLLGTQETLGFQRDYLAERFTEFDNLGVGRNDGGSEGEMTALFYRKSRFEKVDGGHFWLSETPETVGSKSWDSALPRMVTWVKLRDREQAAAKTIAFFNTHFDHKGEVARVQSARLLRQQLLAIGKDCDLILTGDFNAAGDSSAPYQSLFQSSDSGPAPIVDTFRATHRLRARDEGTFSGFDVRKITGPRIDWIGASPSWQIESADIDRTARGDRTPSDHFPVIAILKRSSTAEVGALPP